jgi:hypothetical protein
MFDHRVKKEIAPASLFEPPPRFSLSEVSRALPVLAAAQGMGFRGIM